MRADSAGEITVDGSLVQESATVLQPAMTGELGPQPKGVRWQCALVAIIA